MCFSTERPPTPESNTPIAVTATARDAVPSVRSDLIRELVVLFADVLDELADEPNTLVCTTAAGNQAPAEIGGPGRGRALRAPLAIYQTLCARLGASRGRMWRSSAARNSVRRNMTECPAPSIVTTSTCGASISVA